MFERYTEQARKAVFFARYEATQCGSPQIETEHLLLGLLREDTQLAQRLLLSPTKVEAIREQIGKRFEGRNCTSTSVDLPLSDASKRALKYGAEEANKLKHSRIGPEHLLLGIAREESCLAAGILRQNGLTSTQLRDVLAKPVEAPPAVGPFRDLIQAARKGESGPLIGREREIEVSFASYRAGPRTTLS